jgi:hypothetical protein
LYITWKLLRKEPSRELVPVDDVVGNPPFIIRHDHRIVTAFAGNASAENWGARQNRTSMKAALLCTPQRGAGSFSGWRWRAVGARSKPSNSIQAFWQRASHN